MKLYLVQIGNSARLSRALEPIAMDMEVETLDWRNITKKGSGRRILFAVHVDALGVSEEFCGLLRLLRSDETCLFGAVAGIVIDGDTELYTKQAAQDLALAANMSGCMLLGKSLVEGTGSLYNQHILARRMGLGWEETYFARVRELALRVVTFRAIRYERPRLLMLHASDNRQSNTVWMGREVVSRLKKLFDIREICLQNGTIQDCRGCSYEACLHFANNGTCFYGGFISNDVLPAIEESDVLLFLCPNYNDAVSANLMALFNRLTNLLVRHQLSEKYLYGIVVSGYSGSDLVARQLLGAISFNKTAILPPYFCLMQTANDAGSAAKMAGISEKIDDFAALIRQTVLLRK